MQVATTCHATSLFTNGPETQSFKVKGHGINTLADSGSQVNTVMPGYVHQHKFTILLLEDLVDHPLNLIELGPNLSVLSY